MADKLIVKNFGPIINAELDIKKTTVFIGLQGSGKSTLAKLVAACNIPTNFLFQKKFWVDEGMKGELEKFSKEIFDAFNLSPFIENRSKFKYSTKDFFIKYADNQLVFNVKEKTNKHSDVTSIDSKPNTGLLVGGLLLLSLFAYVLSKSNKNSDNKLKDESIDLSILSEGSIFIPTERSFITTFSDSIYGMLSADSNIPKVVLNFGKHFEIARKELKELSIEFLKIRYVHENQENRVYLDKKKYISLKDTASGFQSVIPLMLTVEYFSTTKDNQHFIIEEPELNLYPTTQKELVYYLVKSCTRGNNELLMTTHSPYILAALNNLIFAFKTAQKHPDKADEVAKIVPRESWLNPDDFAAYFVADGTVRAIINPKTGMIAENELDGVSEDFKIEFDELVEIYRLPVHETVY